RGCTPSAACQQNSVHPLSAREALTATAQPPNPELDQLYQKAIEARDRADWWLAGCYLKSILRTRPAHRDASAFLQKLTTEHPQGKIAVAEGNNICLMDAWGDKREQIETGRVVALSPSGRQIAFIRGNHLMVGPINGEHQVVLKMDLRDQPPYEEATLAWTPGEQGILLPIDVFDDLIKDNLNQREIGLLTLATKQLRKIVSLEPLPDPWPQTRYLMSPTFDPTGERLAYARYCPFGAGTIIVYHTRHGSRTEILQGPHQIAWAPDGSLIAYGGRHGVYTMRPDGSNAKPLVDNDGMPLLDSRVTFVTWAPDGKKLLCAVDDAGMSTDLWVINLPSLEAFRIATFDWLKSPPSWAP
ncbi:MAG TPA: hypothetical protein PLG21_21400, partial [Anaerolineae bacterium]|nr:hypothetical protein [Anaerolineae bacterium]